MKLFGFLFFALVSFGLTSIAFAFDEITCEVEFVKFEGNKPVLRKDFTQAKVVEGSFGNFYQRGRFLMFPVNLSGFVKVRLSDQHYNGNGFLEVESRRSGEAIVRFGSRATGFPENERVLQHRFGGTGLMVLFSQNQQAIARCQYN